MLRRQHVEARQRAVGREVGLPDRSSVLLAQHLLASGSTPSQQLSRREMIQKVRKAVTQLRAEDHEILLMRNFEGLSYQEVACLLDIEVPAARQRHGRALLRLHQLLAEGGITESQL
jgi:RNA polymerase sigma-70 factor (ECF subfamily)